jgi:hypothetical protein
LFRFIGVNDQVELDFADKSRFHILGNRMRHQFTGEVRTDQAWKTKLTLEQLSYFQARAGWMNRHYGYVD